MGEKGIEAPGTAADPGRFAGYTVAPGVSGALGAAGSLASGTPDMAPRPGAGLATTGTDMSLAPDPTSVSKLAEPPKG
jgi:hypothetical protein